MSKFAGLAEQGKCPVGGVDEAANGVASGVGAEPEADRKGRGGWWEVEESRALRVV